LKSNFRESLYKPSMKPDADARNGAFQIRLA